ncbi:2-oxoglutarate and iron-dependent oxygenase JMJD4 [Hylaeus anthracinus]|uniref:2-oxoglutarate and iron-dependent oxygenase JMJD4 n=1 Tax=Hylaeus volcanicus TaxID=313075 RepID=UPI0023B87B35|nr:2-oxoglutarate and iron-dependent oxygenase JMJD4 [Hylaeus volcanicus]XP_054006931.1 2-oxoglutarate and iron-dependent oxygenase JMJD4 [Hylaeus anthracinus]XP_054006932.1 2-oxoglutarate and iron-dependent oxygenase JMJD4 [Hylaeus anthracinus]
MLQVLEIKTQRLSINKDTAIIDWIDHVNPSITYDEFFSKYLIPNKPCIFNSKVTENWSCRRQWSDEDAPDFDVLDLLFGNCVVPVADCNKKYYNSQSKDDMKMKDYLNYWMDYTKSNYSDSRSLLYLKDWHCPRLFPNAPMYNIPQYFASDWLNEYYIAHPQLNDDYRFVYMGPSGTWTPLHADVFGSYSWSANIVGKKRWLLFPPHQEDFLRDVHGQLIYDATSEELNDFKKYKAYDKRALKYIDVIQNQGEIMFVPSGWHHQVWNLNDTISINHNWINGCNIMDVWHGLKKELCSVIEEVNDCQDMSNWADHCQLILKSTYGMDYYLFFDFITYIAKQRLNMILKKEKVISFNKFEFGVNHCIFDLDAIRLVLIDFINDAEEKSIYDLICERKQGHKLLNKIVLLLQTHNTDDFSLTQKTIETQSEDEA